MNPRDVLALIDRSGETLERVLAAVPRVVPLLDRAEALMDELERLVARIEGTRRSAATMVRRAEEPLGRLSLLLDAVEPPLLTLRPTLERLAERTSPEDAESVGNLLDRMPPLMERLERDVLPVIDAMRTVAPDMHDLVSSSRELNELLVNVPGMGRIKKRMDEESAEE